MDSTKIRSKEGKNLIWLSWYQSSKDYRPICFPPTPKALLGWWCTGSSDSQGWTMCALVEDQGSEENTWNIILDKDCWPDAGARRFYDSVGLIATLSNRFPVTNWMTERMDVIK